MSEDVPPTDENGSGVDSRLVDLHQAYYKIKRAANPVARKAAEEQLAGLLAKRHAADKAFAAIALAAMEGDAAKAEAMLEGPVEALSNVRCHQKAVETVVTHCGAFNDYSLRYGRLFANLCNSDISEQAVVVAIEKGCKTDIVV